MLGADRDGLGIGCLDSVGAGHAGEWTITTRAETEYRTGHELDAQSFGLAWICWVVVV